MSEVFGKLPVNVPADGVFALISVDDQGILRRKRSGGIGGFDRLNLGNGKRREERNGESSGVHSIN
jgi:hypothetical protein